MVFVRWLDKISKDWIDLAGSKGANLGELLTNQFPVPFGFVITTNAFKNFIESKKLGEKINLVLEKSGTDPEKISEASLQIKQLILETEFPAEMKKEIIEAYKSLSFSDTIRDEKVLQLISVGRDFALVAVRSSVPDDFSIGTKQTNFLNVKGIGDLLISVKNCWASFFESHSILELSKKDWDLRLGLVVQRMINSEKSVVMKTDDSEDRILIKATWGMGQTLSSGKVKPDVYSVLKNGQIAEVKVSQKERMTIRDYATDRTIEIPVPKDKMEEQVLSDQDISRLVKLGLQVENHYQSPQEIEFALHLNKIYITQTKSL